MLLPAPDTSSLPLDGSFTPGTYGVGDVADPSGSTATPSIDGSWQTTLRDILQTTVAAADKTYLPGTPAAGVPTPHLPVSGAGIQSPAATSSLFSSAHLLLIGGLVLLAVVLVVAMKHHSA